ncbi:MAG TPA: tetratricopeptide repeat protein [Chloroflexota bacterium]|nr:tetratricopeptide repeat protein [Chloroflexota bacterium]
MTAYQSEDRMRIKRVRAEKAIQLAMQNRWLEASEVNRQIIELFPDDVDSYNRLGKALMELGQYPESRDAYREASRLDPSNTIAARNLQRLEQLTEGDGDATPPTPVDPRLFIEEAGKTAVTALTDLADRSVLVRLTAGDQLTIDIDGNVVKMVDQTSEVIGLVEPKLAQRIVRLVQMGNKFSAAVTAADDQSVRVIIREVYRDPSMGNRASFPMAIPPDQFRAYVKDSLLRYDLDDDEDLLDDAEVDATADVEAEVETDATAETEVSLDDPAVVAAEGKDDDDEDED